MRYSLSFSFEPSSIVWSIDVFGVPPDKLIQPICPQSFSFNFRVRPPHLYRVWRILIATATRQGGQGDFLGFTPDMKACEGQGQAAPQAGAKRGAVVYGGYCDSDIVVKALQCGVRRPRRLRERSRPIYMLSIYTYITYYHYIIYIYILYDFFSCSCTDVYSYGSAHTYMSNQICIYTCMSHV